MVYCIAILILSLFATIHCFTFSLALKKSGLIAGRYFTILLSITTILIPVYICIVTK